MPLRADPWKASQRPPRKTAMEPPLDRTAPAWRAAAQIDESAV
jgi:hypothetical protein